MITCSQLTCKPGRGSERLPRFNSFWSRDTLRNTLGSKDEMDSRCNHDNVP